MRLGGGSRRNRNSGKTQESSLHPTTPARQERLNPREYGGAPQGSDAEGIWVIMKSTLKNRRLSPATNGSGTLPC